MTLATANLFKAKWTDDIHDEWTRSLLASRPDITAEKLQRIRALMDIAVPDSKDLSEMKELVTSPVFAHFSIRALSWLAKRT